MAENQEPVKVEEQGPFIHQLQLFLVGGQQFTVNELSDSVKMPQNVIAFINAWRQKRDVWHSPNNDPKFGVRVKDVSLYEYRVGKASAVKPAESVAAPAPAAAPAVSSEEDYAKLPGCVKSPMVGVVYLSADPNSPDYVKVGSSVAEGDTVCLIEAMKTFNPVKAHKGGKVTKILVAGGDPVEYGEPLIIIE